MTATQQLVLVVAGLSAGCLVLGWEFSQLKTLEALQTSSFSKRHLVSRAIWTVSLVMIVLAGCTDSQETLSTATPVVEDTPLAKVVPVVATEIPTPTSVQTETPTPTLTPTEVPAFTATPAPMDTPLSTPTLTPSPTPTEVPTATATATEIPTLTTTPIPTAIPTRVPTDTPTSVPTSTAVPTDTPTSVPTQTAVPTATPTPVPTATRTPTMTPIPTATHTPTVTPTPTATPTSTPTPTPTVTPTPTPTQIPGRSDLYEVANTPEHMAFLQWNWERGRTGFSEMTTNFTIHNDPGNFSTRNGLYFIVANGDMFPGDVGYYFGLQTNVQDPVTFRGRGKGIIFSRWDERDLSYARVAEGGFAQSSGHEGDFIGVRIPYEWTTGSYSMRIAIDEKDVDGDWYGLWITDQTTETTTWAGSLKFAPGSRLKAISYSTLEIYGSRIRPIGIPEWQVSIERPLGGTVKATMGYLGNMAFHEQILNSDVWYDSQRDLVHLVVGGLTERLHENRVWVEFE